VDQLAAEQGIPEARDAVDREVPKLTAAQTASVKSLKVQLNPRLPLPE